MFENGVCLKTYHYEDKIRQYRSIYQGKLRVDYDMVLESVFMAFIADLKELKVYEYF